MPSINRKLLTTLLLLSIIMLNGCAMFNLTGSDESDVKRYEIARLTNLSQNLDAEGPSLIIYPIKTSSVYKTPRMAYQIDQYEIAYYAKNKWADTPSQLLFPILVASMENSGRFSAVISSSSSAITDYALDVELLSLLHQHNNGKSKVQLTLRVQLLNLNKRIVIKTQTIEITEPTEQNDPYGAVVATNEAAKKMVSALQDFVRGN